MDTPSAPDVTLEAARGVFTRSAHPYTPLTAEEVAEALDCSEREAGDRLKELAGRGDLVTKQVGDGARIWWPAADGDAGATDPRSRSDLEQLGTFISAVKDYAIFTLDPEGHVVSWNDGAERIKGYSEDEILGEHFSTFYTDDDIAAGAPEENLEAATAHGRVEDQGWRVRRDGTTFWADVVITAIRDEDDTLQGYTKVTRDLTARREYEQQLREERDIVEQIIETVPVSIVVMTPEGDLVRANSRALDRLGIEGDDLDRYSTDSWILTDESGEPIPPGETPWVRAAEAGEPVYDDRCQVELPDVGRRWLSFNAAPIRTTDDSADRVVLAMDDITQQMAREAELRRERNQTEELLRTTPVAIVVQDADGETLLANQRAREFLEPAEEGRIEEPRADWTLYDADGTPLEPEDAPTARVRATAEPVDEQEIAIENSHGERRWFATSANPVFGPDGELDRVVTAAEDITALKRREQQLARRRSELETELSEIFGRISDAFYALDENWRFTHVNEQAAAILQRPREDLLGERLWAVFPEAKGSRVWDRFHEAMETQEPVSFEIDYDPASMWLEVNVYPSETGLSVYFQDVTERKEREQDLERYRTIVETVRDGIYTVDPAGRFTMVNEAYVEMTGYSRDELIGSDVSLVVDDEVVDEARRTESALVDGEDETVAIEAELIRADGERIPAEATFALFPSGEEYERIGVVRDISERKEHERAIEESERRYRTLAENFPNGAVGLFDENLTYTAIGGELLEMAGVDPADRIGHSVYEIYPDDVVEEFEPYFQAALEGDANAFETGYLDRHLFAQTLPVENDEGEVFAGMLVVQDVTERRETQQELQKSEARFRMIAENLEEIVWMATEDADEFIYINPAFEEVWGVDRTALYEDPHAFLEAVHPDDRDRVRDEFSALPQHEFEDEFRIVRPDGEARWVYGRGTRVVDANSELTRVVGIGDDITSRVERERELERARDLLAKTERIADVGGWEIDVDTMDVFWTDHIFELLDIGGDEEPPLDAALDMYHEADKPAVVEAVEHALDSGDPFDIEARIHTDPGEVRWLRLQGVPESEGDDVVSLRGAAQDITERKQREQRLEELIDRLEESNRRLEQFAYAASHDLQEPLRMVSSYLQLIERRYRDVLDEEGQEFLEFAVDGADRMRNMIDGLLKYSRVETQGGPLGAIDLDDVLEDVLEDLQIRIQETDADITADELPRVRGDAGQLQQVLQNLLKNAIEYSGEAPPRIHVSAERDGSEWVIAVSDEGIGIDPEYQDQIFEVFQRLHDSTDHAGIGIGLALCERIVERHGGRVWVESEPGEGSTFYFTLRSPVGDDR